MAFAANDRVRVTAQNSEFRQKSGTIEVAAADTSDNLNRVRIDGHAVGYTQRIPDADLGKTTQPAPVQYV